MEIDRQSLIDAEHAILPEHKPFVVTDLAFAISERKKKESIALGISIHSDLQIDNPDYNAQGSIYEACGAIIVQREIIDREPIEPNEFALILSSADWSTLLRNRGKEYSESEIQNLKNEVMEMGPVVWEFYQITNNKPGYELEVERNLDAAIQFAMQRGITILDVFRNDEEYLEFARTQLTPEKITASTNLLLGEDGESEKFLKAMMEKQIKAELKDQLDEEDFDEFLQKFLQSSDYSLMQFIFKTKISQMRQAYNKHYLNRYFGTQPALKVEE